MEDWKNGRTTLSVDLNLPAWGLDDQDKEGLSNRIGIIYLLELGLLRVILKILVHTNENNLNIDNTCCYNIHKRQTGTANENNARNHTPEYLTAQHDRICRTHTI